MKEKKRRRRKNTASGPIECISYFTFLVSSFLRHCLENRDRDRDRGKDKDSDRGRG